MFFSLKHTKHAAKLNWLFINALHKGFVFSKDKYFLILRNACNL